MAVIYLPRDRQNQFAQQLPSLLTNLAMAKVGQNMRMQEAKLAQERQRQATDQRRIFELEKAGYREGAPEPRGAAMQGSNDNIRDSTDWGVNVGAKRYYPPRKDREIPDIRPLQIGNKTIKNKVLLRGDKGFKVIKLDDDKASGMKTFPLGGYTWAVPVGEGGKPMYEEAQRLPQKTPGSLSAAKAKAFKSLSPEEQRKSLLPGKEKTPSPTTWFQGSRALRAKYGSESPTGKIIISPDLYGQASLAQKKFVELQQGGMHKPLDAVNIAHERTQNIVESYWRQRDAIKTSRDMSKEEKRRELKILQSDFKRAYKFVPMMRPRGL